MAVDEALLGTAASPTLRFYRWHRPALSFGYFGRYAEVADQCGDREIVRAAHRRSRAGLLHQGSIQSTKLPQRFIDDFARALCERFERRELSQELIDHATTIARAKYGTIEWLMRR